MKLMKAFLVSLSMFYNSPNGQGSHWVCQGKQGERVCCVKSRLASDRGLVQINESLCKYVFAAIVNV